MRRSARCVQPLGALLTVSVSHACREGMEATLGWGVKRDGWVGNPVNSANVTAHRLKRVLRRVTVFQYPARCISRCLILASWHLTRKMIGS